jgi:hypothetical protein
VRRSALGDARAGLAGVRLPRGPPLQRRLPAGRARQPRRRGALDRDPRAPGEGTAEAPHAQGRQLAHHAQPGRALARRGPGGRAPGRARAGRDQASPQPGAVAVAERIRAARSSGRRAGRDRREVGRAAAVRRPATGRRRTRPGGPNARANKD